MKSIHTIKNLSMTASTALALCVISSGAIAADINPFAATALTQGYQLAASDEKSTEGKCGVNKAKMEEAKCGANKAKTEEGKCGGSKAKMEEGKCGENKAKAKEGKCGEAKCGANQGK
jgi:uncharacterized low-complexity protein